MENWELWVASTQKISILNSEFSIIFVPLRRFYVKHAVKGSVLCDGELSNNNLE